MPKNLKSFDDEDDEDPSNEQQTVDRTDAMVQAFGTSLGNDAMTMATGGFPAGASRISTRTESLEDLIRLHALMDPSKNEAHEETNAASRAQYLSLAVADSYFQMTAMNAFTHPSALTDMRTHSQARLFGKPVDDSSIGLGGGALDNRRSVNECDYRNDEWAETRTGASFGDGKNHDASRLGSDDSSSVGKKRRRKSTPADTRWSRRYTWPDHHHRAFVSAIFDVGLRESTAAAILEKMRKDASNGVPTDWIHKKLRSYRSNYADLKKALIESSDFLAAKTSPQEDDNRNEEWKWLKGTDHGDDTNPAADSKKKGTSMGALGTDEILKLPEMTEAERSSLHGLAMGHLVALVFSLKKTINLQRAAKERTQIGDLSEAFAALSESKRGPGVELSSGGTVEHDIVQKQQSSQPIEKRPDFAQSPTPRGDSSSPLPAMLEAIVSNQAQATSLDDSRGSDLLNEMQSRMVLQLDLRSLKKQEYEKFNLVKSHEMSEDKSILGNGTSDSTQARQEGSLTELENATTGQEQERTAWPGEQDTDDGSLAMFDKTGSDGLDEKFFDFLSKN